METIRIRQVDSVTVTTLIDNSCDLLLSDKGPARRATMSGDMPTKPAPTLHGGEGYDYLRAEHGFSVLLEITSGKNSHCVLYDAGMTPDGLIDNMRRLGKDPRDVEAIVLSHGHWDHTTGLNGLAHTLGKTSMPVFIHPEFWARRRIAIPGKEPVELLSTSRNALLGIGFEIIENVLPSFLLDSSLLVTGEVDRTNDFEKGFPVHQAHTDGEWRPDPLILDDQAAILNVKNKGLVVITGCGHSGVVNILNYAKKLTGENRIYAVIGGFHLSGPVFEPLIPATVASLVDINPEFVVPGHCTGWKAGYALASALPEAFIPNSVGTRFEL